MSIVFDEESTGMDFSDRSFRNSLVSEFKQMMPSQIGSDAEIKHIGSLCVDCNANLVFNMIGSETRQMVRVPFTPSELKKYCK